MKKKIIALLLATVLALMTLAGCGESATPALTFRETVLTENEYCYWMSYYKGYFLQNYFGLTQDNAAIWTTEMAEGVTVGDYLELLAQTSVMSMLVYTQLFDEYGLSLTSEEEAAVSKTVDDLMASVGGKSALNAILSAYYINVDMLREIKLDQAKIAKVQDYLYGENGIESATGAELSKYYSESYYRARYIYISSSKEYIRDENGAVLVNEDGTYQTRDLNAAEKIEKQALVKDIEMRLAAGEDFEALLTEYTMDMGMLNFPDGYYFNSSSAYLQYIDSAALSGVPNMAIDATETVETDAGWYIIKRLPLVEGAYTNDTYAVMFADLKTQVNSVKMQSYVASFAEEILPNNEVLNSCRLAYSTPNFYY